jgi:hypothetical protein
MRRQTTSAGGRRRQREQQLVPRREDARPERAASTHSLLALLQPRHCRKIVVARVAGALTQQTRCNKHQPGDRASARELRHDSPVS